MVMLSSARCHARLAAAGLLAAALAALGGAGQAVASTEEAAARVHLAALAVLRAIDVPAAWRTSRGNGVIVAVLDTGTDASAPDLAGSVLTGPDYTAGADPAGYQPPHLHGTYIASIIAGHGSGPGRAAGMIGVAPAARILSVRVILDDQEPGFRAYSQNASYYDAVAKGVRYAVRRGAGVINMSLGSTGPTSDLRLAIGYAISRGVVVVAAAGNNGSAASGFTPYSYPASFTGVISVAAVHADGRRAAFSDRNASVVISAPGVDIDGAGPGSIYLGGSGTSPASALIAGVAALIRSRYPRLTPALVTQALVSSAQHRPPGGYRPGVGFGEVDAAAALAAAGRLARQQPATGIAATGMPAGGMSATARFGAGALPPIVVVRRDEARIDLLTAIAGVAALGFITAMTALAVLARRGRRKRRYPAGLPRPAHRRARPAHRLGAPQCPCPAVTVPRSDRAPQ